MLRPDPDRHLDEVGGLIARLDSGSPSRSTCGHISGLPFDVKVEER